MQITNPRIKTKIKEEYKKILDIFFPKDTKRRYVLALFKKSVLTFYKEGFRALIRKANKRILIKRKVSKEDINILYIPNSVELYYTPNILPIKVSVVIPTRNPDESIEYTFKKIKSQRGINEIEIIAVDSSSNKETNELVKKYSSKYFFIKPEDFHNSETRNFAFERSTGNYLIFLVQNCIPAGESLFYNLLFPIVNKNIHALTVRKIPRIDADLFETWLIWQKYRYLGFSGDFIRNNKLFNNFESLELKDKYRYSFLDNTCLAIDREIFNKYRFNSQFFEDIELGKRLLIDGYNLMYISSFAVIHSQNRNALDYFKQGYIEIDSINKIFGISANDRDIDEIYIALEFLLKCFVITMADFNNIENVNGNSIFKHLEHFEKLVNKETKLEDFNLEKLFERELNGVLNFLIKDRQTLEHDLNQFNKDIVKDILNLYKSFAINFNEYICNYLDINNSELSNNLSKLFYYSLGQYLGNTSADIETFKEV